MDEAKPEEQIVAELAANLPKPEIPENGWDIRDEPKTEAKPEDEQFIDKMTPESTVEQMKLYDYFQLSSLDRANPDAQKYLKTVMDWARDEAKSSDYADMLRVINDQERVMGNLLKGSRLSNLYRFVTIRSQRNRLIQEERALYNG